MSGAIIGGAIIAGATLASTAYNAHEQRKAQRSANNMQREAQQRAEKQHKEQMSKAEQDTNRRQKQQVNAQSFLEGAYGDPYGQLTGGTGIGADELALGESMLLGGKDKKTLFGGK